MILKRMVEGILQILFQPTILRRTSNYMVKQWLTGTFVNDKAYIVFYKLQPFRGSSVTVVFAFDLMKQMVPFAKLLKRAKVTK